MTDQWRDELEAKFGLAFQIIDRDHLAEHAACRGGFGANPWRLARGSSYRTAS